LCAISALQQSKPQSLRLSLGVSEDSCRHAQACIRRHPIIGSQALFYGLPNLPLQPTRRRLLARRPSRLLPCEIRVQLCWRVEAPAG
jgi:hypothetical protein